MHSLRRLTLEYELSCPAFCMMPNHFHAIFEGARDAMSRLMHRLNGVHAQRFNERHDRSGHLFQSRFHAREIQDDEQFGRAIDYVWANPVRAGLCAEPHDWRWSGQVLRPRVNRRGDADPNRGRKDAILDEGAYCVLNQALPAGELELHTNDLDEHLHDLRADPRPGHRGRVQLVVGRAAHDHLAAPEADDPPPVALAPAPLRQPPLALRVHDRHHRLGALHPRAPARAALARPDGLRRRPRPARGPRAAGGRSSAPAAASGSASASRSSGSYSCRSPSPAARAASSTGSWIAVTAWFAISFVAVGISIGPAASRLAPGAGFGIGAGLHVRGGRRRHEGGGARRGARSSSASRSTRATWLAFILIQLSFQRGRALATAGLSSFCTNALPIAAGLLIFHETAPPGVLGALRFVAFGCVVLGAAFVARREGGPEERPSTRTPPSCRSRHLRPNSTGQIHRLGDAAPIGFRGRECPRVFSPCPRPAPELTGRPSTATSSSSPDWPGLSLWAS